MDGTQNIKFDYNPQGSVILKGGNASTSPLNISQRDKCPHWKIALKGTVFAKPDECCMPFNITDPRGL
ncbi:hypothetical protein CDV36_003672 [Fusarium kuroshium]|uniref:Uncharacterized protein n=1 Tax=Fusarium kuroshium TaxID=2010991 RepID=A0A3M2SGF7_9HYPO|nr:hypothetical protein CDV36_003672 [Fusarium kuroshium]